LKNEGSTSEKHHHNGNVDAVEKLHQLIETKKK
jgi:hypothetical protein